MTVGQVGQDSNSLHHTEASSTLHVLW